MEAISKWVEENEEKRLAYFELFHTPHCIFIYYVPEK